ncbi:MAG: LPS assembly lipoprotein LptE [Pseudomonadota bacterium]
MWLFDRRFVLAGALALSACGLTPVYGPGGTGTALRGQVQLDAPETRLDFEFIKAVDARLGRTTNGALGLAYDITVTEDSTVVSSAQEINRLSVLGTVAYTLTDANQTVLGQGSVRGFTSYSATGSTLATDAAQRNAQDRLMIILADQMISQLILDLSK